MVHHYHVITLLLVSLAHAAVVRDQSFSRGAEVRVWLGPGPGPHKVWSVGKCWHWNAPAAPPSQQGKLDASFCRSVRVPKRATYHIIADISATARTSDSLGITRMFKNGKLMLWRHYYYEHEKSAHKPIKAELSPGVDYTLCFTGRRQSFDLCRLELYACQSDICRVELEHHSIMALSRRNR